MTVMPLAHDGHMPLAHDGVRCSVSRTRLVTHVTFILTCNLNLTLMTRCGHNAWT